jgi:hypothetical protein
MKAWSFQRAGTLLAVVVVASAANAHPPAPPKPDLVCDVSIVLPSGRTITNGETLELLNNATLTGTVHYAIRNRTAAPAGASFATRGWSLTTFGGSFPSDGGLWQDIIPALGPRGVKQLSDAQMTIHREGTYLASAAADFHNQVIEENETNNNCPITFTVKHAMPPRIPVETK